jgi:hypothetical protein
MAQVFNANANPTLPDVAIHIGGKERPMAFCYRSIAALENKHQQSVGELLGKMDRLSIATDLLHAALWRDDQSLTVDQVSEWVTFLNLKPIQDALLATWFGSVPESNASGEAPAQAQQ